MILYILKFSACLALFLVFYKFVLEKENMHVFKRFFLLAAVLLSISIPLITFTYYVAPTAEVIPQIILDTPLENTAIILEAQTNYLSSVLWSIYSIGLLLFGFKFIKNLYDLSYKIKYNPKRKIKSITNVLLQDLVTPHTFFNYIFFNKHKYEADEIPQEVLWHEQTHARQKHSIDVVFIELLQVIFWFNPLLYIIKHVIKLNHEFLADQAVLNNGVETTTYQQTLLAFSSNATQPQLANAINYSLIKKRFTVMKTQTTTRGIWLRSFVLLPLLALSLYSFSDTVIVEKDSSLKIESSTDKLTLQIAQEKATKKQIAEYNKLAKKYNDMPKDNMNIRKDDIKRLKYLYDLMSDDQKKNAEDFPDIPEPPAPKAPSSVKAVQPNSPPPPPLPANATEAQKIKYKKAYQEARVAAKVLKLKAQKERSIRVIETRSDEDRKHLKEVKLAYRETQAAARVLKLKAQKRELVKVREIRVAKLKEEKLVHREAQAAARVLKLKAQKGKLVKVREIQSVKLKKEKLAHREAQAVVRVLKLKAQKEKLIKVRALMPPPPPLPENATPAQKRKYEEAVKKYKLQRRKKTNDGQTLKIKDVPPPPPIPEMATVQERAEMTEVTEAYYNQQITEVEIVEVPEVIEIVIEEPIEVVEIEEIMEAPGVVEIIEVLPPPPPKSPIEHIKDMAKKGANFFFNGKSISPEKAIKLIRSKKNLNILTNHTDDKKYVVKLSTKPIVIED